MFNSPPPFQMTLSSYPKFLSVLEFKEEESFFIAFYAFVMHFLQSFFKGGDARFKNLKDDVGWLHFLSSILNL